MSGDEDQQRPHDSQQGRAANGDRNAQGGQEQAKNSAPGTSSVSTSNPAIGSLAARSAPPERTVSYQTSQLAAPPAPYPFGTEGGVVEEHGGEDNADRQDRRQGTNKQDTEKDKRQDQDKDKRGKDEQGGQQKEKRHWEDRKHPPSQNDHDGERRRRKKKKHEHAASPLSWKSLAITAVLALVFGVGGAWGYSAFFGPSSENQDKSSGKGDKSEKRGGDKGGKSDGKKSGKSGSEESDKSAGGASASEIPGFTSAKDSETLKKELEHLAHRLDLLGSRIDQMTEPEHETPPVLHTLQMKMNELEREVDQVANLPSKMRHLDQRVVKLKEDFKELKQRISGEEMPTGGDLAPPSVGSYDAEAALGTADPANEATFRLAIGLFREGHYSQAYEVLRRLQRERPSDARVWYYSALANGLATGQWDGKTKQLAEQGIACERAGKPSRAAIDKALSDLSPASGTKWLADQRRQVKTQ
jgi:hypothetical protein